MRFRAAAFAATLSSVLLTLPAAPAAGEGYDQAGVNVPPDRLPPPGLCRVWFPERPPDRQPPSASCDALQRNLPYGALLLDGGPGPGGAYATEADYGAAPLYDPIPVPRPQAFPAKPYCREFQRKVAIGERPERAYGVACQQPDGSWKVVR